MCWGKGDSGQLGQGAAQGSPKAVAVGGLGPALEVTAAGAHSCARTAQGTVFCWGSNKRGELGNGAGAATIGQAQVRPVMAAKLTDAAEITAGLEHSCARRSNGAVACWGSGTHGALGAGTSNDWTMRVPVQGLVGVRTISSGANHVCALGGGGVISCWGDNAAGQVGEAPRTIHRSPVIGQRIGDAVELAAGWDHTCARLEDGRVACWGANGDGQAGDGATARSLVPTPVDGLP